MTDNTTNAVIDLSHYNTVSSFEQIKAAGIAGIIHKATQGTKYVDPTYEPRQQKALNAGLLWGAYHFGTGDDPVAQANHFLDTVKPDSKTLIALDLESNPTGSSMSRAEAEAFVTVIHDRIRRWPVLYTGRWYLDVIMRRDTKTVLSNCPLWLAAYTPIMPTIPSQWPTWAFWQYTNGHNNNTGAVVAGVSPCDRNRFNGTLDQLIAWWSDAT